MHAARRASAARTVARLTTLVIGVGFAVVGIAGAASAHHNTITGTVSCRTGGGWAVTWQVVNSEARTETITSSSRTSVVPVGTQLTSRQTRTFAETVTTKPAADVTLQLGARWDNGQTNTSTGTIPVGSFSDGCAVTTVAAPTIPVVDDCGPGNARYGAVPAGPWTATTNPDGSVVVTANQGTRFTNGQTTVTYPVPADSNEACPTPPTTPPTIPPTTTPPTTPPTTTPQPPEVLPAQVRVVTAKARAIDKCGRAGDVFRVAPRRGVVYTVGGTTVKQGVWLKARTRTVTVRATSADETVQLKGRQAWRISFTNRACAQPPKVSPETGR